MKPYRIGLVDDQNVSREGIGGIVTKAESIDLTVVAASVEELVRYGKPELDAVVLDYELDPEGLTDGKAVEHLAKTLNYKVLVLSASDHVIPVLSSWYAGASGYITKGAFSAEIIKAIETVASGQPYYSPTVANYLIHDTNTMLTPRELEIMQLVAEGHTDLEISKTLQVAKRTINSNMVTIKNKIGENRRTAVAVYASNKPTSKWRKRGA